MSGLFYSSMKLIDERRNPQRDQIGFERYLKTVDLTVICNYRGRTRSDTVLLEFMMTVHCFSA